MAHYLGKTLIKKWLIAELRPFLRSHGFSVRASVNVDIIRQMGKDTYSCMFSVDSTDGLSYSGAVLRYEPVEELIYKLTGLPRYVGGAETVGYSPPELVNAGSRSILVKSDVMEVVAQFKSVFESQYLPFYARYSQPAALLELWDSLPTPQEKLTRFADPYNHHKMLIVAHAVEDPNYNQRIADTIRFYEELIAGGMIAVGELLRVYRQLIAHLEQHGSPSL